LRNERAARWRQNVQKTVYVLGAGFSVDAGAPLQSDIIKRIFELKAADLPKPERATFIQSRSTFRTFLERDLCMTRAHFERVSLEDVYTPIDRCISDNVGFRSRSNLELPSLRQQISALIILLLKHSMPDHTTDNYVSRFAEFLAYSRRKAPLKADPLAVISLNWDIAIDNALRRAIPDSDGVVDYCCYVNAYNSFEPVLPGLLAIGMGKYNLKLLKLHGSMNWLQCQRCQRLYVTFFQKIAAHEFLGSPTCTQCTKNYGDLNSGEPSSRLQSQLIMPTFLKDLSNVQIKLIWQNAGIELAEADRIIFIGYSFPQADFEFRQLLARFVRKTAKIEVILKDESAESSSPEWRYRSFFGKRQLRFRYGGAAQYISDECQEAR
jgi:NAD-dependent SIR2 family protein deacetylase